MIVVNSGEWWLVEPNGKATRNHGMLRSEARLGGRPFYVLEVERAGYDEEFEDPVFRIALRPGRRFTGA